MKKYIYVFTEYVELLVVLINMNVQLDFLKSHVSIFGNFVDYEVVSA